MDTYDVVIIGGGPAGLSAGLYACRANLKTLLVEKGMPGGQAATTDKIENYPGFPEAISGPDLMMKMDEQARKFGMETSYTEILSINQGEDQVFHLKTHSEDILAKSLIVATGAWSKPLGVPGEDAYLGRGVSYCATCDGAFFQGKTVAVVGGGDSALQEGMFLTKFADKVYIVHRRDELRATKVVQDKVKNYPKIEFILDSVITGILGQDKVEAVKIKNVKTDAEKAIAVDGIFVYVGKEPSTEMLKGFIDLDQRGYILTNERMQTSRKGVFAAGDVRQTPLRQVVTAVSDGAIAAVAVEHYLEHEKE